MKRVLITGANKGIGRATVAAVLAARDDSFVFLGSRDAARGEEAREALLEQHPEWASRIEVLEIDVSNDASVSAASAKVAGRFGAEATPLYGIINNAGVGAGEMQQLLNVNARGPRRVCSAFLSLLEPDGRIVNVASASGPVFVAGCSPERQSVFTNPEVVWADIEAVMEECVAIEASGGSFEEAGFGSGSGYGLSKACLNAYTIELARQNPSMTINACTPGFIETDMTRGFAASRGVSPEEMGMKPPEAGTRAAILLLFGEPGGSGWYFGSDAERSPLDRYRNPGDPPYTGE